MSQLFNFSADFGCSVLAVYRDCIVHVSFSKWGKERVLEEKKGKIITTMIP